MSYGILIGIIASVIFAILFFYYMPPVQILHFYSKYVLKDKQEISKNTAYFLYTKMADVNTISTKARLLNGPCSDFFANLTGSVADLSREYMIKEGLLGKSNLKERG